MSQWNTLLMIWFSRKSFACFPKWNFPRLIVLMKNSSGFQGLSQGRAGSRLSFFIYYQRQYQERRWVLFLTHGAFYDDAFYTSQSNIPLLENSKMQTLYTRKHVQGETKIIDLNTRDSLGRTQFMKACINGHNDTVQLIFANVISCKQPKKV